MKHGYAVVLFVFSHVLHAQTVNSLQVLPASPGVTDVVKVVANVTLPTSPCSFITSTTSSSGFDHDIAALYCSGSLQTVCPRSDTFVLGALSAGTHNISFAMLASFGNCTAYVFGDSASFNVSVSGSAGGSLPLNFNPLGPIEFCEGDSVTLMADPFANATYQWFFDGTAIQGANSQFYVAYDSGFYSVKMYANNDSGSALPLLVKVHGSPGPPLSQSGDVIYAPATFLSYQWYSLQNGLISGANASSYLVTQTGDYFVEVENTIGCEGASEPLYVELFDAFIDPDEDQQVCETQPVTLTASPLDTLHSYQWLLGGQVLTGDTNSILQAMDSGHYSVVVSISLSIDTSASMHIGHYPSPAPTLGVNGFTLISSPAVSYQWYSIEEGLLPGDTNQQFTALEGGHFYVKVWDENGCTGLSQSIYLNPIGLDEGPGREWSLKTVLHAHHLDVVLGPGFKGNISLLDLLGNVVQTAEPTGGKHRFDVAALSSGIYLVKASDGQKTTQVRRVYLP